MFNEHLPTAGTRAPQQHSLTKSRRGLFGHSGQHDGGARGRSFHPRVLIGVEDYCVSTKRKIQQETRGRSYGQQNPCEKECHQPKLSVIVQNEKMRDSTICEEESHKIMCERDTQKLSEKEDESCEELFTTNMVIPSSSLVPCVMQAHEENDVVNYEQPPIFDEEVQVMTMDSDTYACVASQDVEVIVHQNPCENENHIAKLRESENKSELCDSTHCDVESINNASVRDTTNKNRELECKSCEDIFETNTRISTSSVVFPNVQVCNENKNEMAAHDDSILVESSEKVAIHPNQLCATQNMNHDDESGKISEASSMILALPQSIKGNENNSNLNF